MGLTIVKGNLLEHSGMIAHQCNASLVGGKPHGIAAAIWDKYPTHRGLYDNDRQHLLGRYIIHDNVINMITQRHPGIHSAYPKSKDPKEDRIEWFRRCLFECMTPFVEMAFPWRIGCGLAGGDWDTYMDMLLEYAKGRQVTVYKL